MEEVSFKQFLQDNDICPKLFWKACKRKHQGWSSPEHYYSRKTLKSSNPIRWIVDAFNCEDNIIFNSYDKWEGIDSKWTNAIIGKIPIFDIDQIDEVESISFKKFLQDNDICPKLFWKACKRKHQGWCFWENYSKRKTIKSQNPVKWISAFNWENNIVSNDFEKWLEINSKWTKAIKDKVPIFDIDQLEE